MFEQLSTIPLNFDASIEWRQFRPDPSVFSTLSPANRRVVVRELRRIDDAACQQDDEFCSVFENDDDDDDSNSDDKEDDESIVNDPKKLENIYRRLVDTIPSDLASRRLDFPIGVAQALFSSTTTTINSQPKTGTLEDAMQNVLVGIRQLEQRVKEREESLVRREADMLQREKTALDRIAAQSAERVAKTQCECEDLRAEAKQLMDRTKKEIDVMKQQIQLERDQWKVMFLYVLLLFFLSI